ncbi:MAG: MFS transporter [Chlamydiales bacterium]|nr:MFS transporter [Chlamydiales bacterium]
MKIGFLITLLSVSSLLIMNTTLPLMSGLYIVSDLGGSQFTGTYPVTFFAIANALGIPLGKYLVDKIGAKKSLLYCLVLFAFVSWFCALSLNFPIFVVLRFIQGLVCGPFYYQISRLLPKSVGITSALLTIAIVSPVVGVSIGGIVAYEYNWRYLFYFDAFIALILAFILSFMKSEENNPKVPFDGFGYICLFIAVTAIGTVLTAGQELDWFRSQLVIALLIIGFISLIFVVFRFFSHPFPIINFRMLTRPLFVFALLSLSLLFSAYFGMVILLVFWLALYVNFTPLWIALLIGTMAIAGILPNYLIQEKIGCDRRIPLLLAIAILVVSCFHTTIFNVDVNFERIAFSRILAGFGLALFLPPLFQISFESFSSKRAVQVLEWFQMTRALACGFGASLYIILWQRRTVFYHERLGSALTDFSQQTADFFSKAFLVGLKGLSADAQLEDYLTRQSIALALDDCFYLMGWLLVGLFVVTLFTFFSRNKVLSSKKKVFNL